MNRTTCALFAGLLCAACTETGTVNQPTPVDSDGIAEDKIPLAPLEDSFCHGSPDMRECDDGDPCTEGDICGGGVCLGRPVLDDPACEEVVEDTVLPPTPDDFCHGVADGTPCDDGTPCTDGDVCGGGICLGRAVAEGTACDDGNLCTELDSCRDDICLGSQQDCTSLDDDCHAGRCDTESGDCESVTLILPGVCDVVVEPEPEPESIDNDFCHGQADGILCDDGSDCTVDDVCGLGVCRGRALANGSTCDDGDHCTLNDSCHTGVCGGAALDCSGLDDSCHVGRCEGDTGECAAISFEDSTSCDTGDFCLVEGACAGGNCVGQARDCSEVDTACRVGNCSSDDARCVAVDLQDATPCQDGDLCTESDSCLSGECIGDQIGCAMLDGVCVVGACQPQSGECGVEPMPAGTVCDDGSLCTLEDRCQEGSCVGDGVDCSSFNADCLFVDHVG